MKAQKKTKYLRSPNDRKITRKRAQQYGEELERLESEHGGITNKLLLAEASHPKSVFHNEFEWDDTKAAHRYRLRQASKLIRWIKIELVYIGDRKPRTLDLTMRAYHSVKNAEGQRQYVHVNRVRDNLVFRQQLIDACLDEGRRWALKAKAFEELENCAIATLDAIEAIHDERQRDKDKKGRKRVSGHAKDGRRDRNRRLQPV